MDQAKSQWDQVRLLLQVNRPTQQRPDLPLDFQPCVWGVFSAPQRDKKGLSLPEPRWCAQHYHDSRRNSYYHRTKGKREDFSGAMWGEETDPTLLSTVPGGYRNPLISALGVQPAETWCSNQGSWSPRCRDWGGGVALETEDLCLRFSPGDCVSSPHPHGSGSCAWGPPAALYLQCVSSSLRFPSSELRVLPWLTCGPFPSLHLVAFA